ncbi:NUDIX hydrolase [Rhodoplanes sp. TEM]|uniref:NUDIX hydrolase n=1 Tax=Rhodoplanes tepidamans TaxID=200616 RepID=A0ABT5J4W0_RHOTP|nr:MULTISPECIES: NUDIX hydrolase [Rhodoplanes]MDC7784662.1 NUDIX hydrolase [Rhodoplanes tepidamans]MDC7982129.1 NUDIX hydrolase [Rhodoplanes sp. TEM]MDQ0356131.1 8-oxo-dGTP pyrophosphatase MutT (NUDIX family) [Rhodoplanes tepidamans]
MTPLSVLPVDRLDLALVPFAWPFAVEHRAEIDVHFAALQRRLPHVWNGRVLLMRDHALVDGTVRAQLFETDFASFMAWRDWGFPDTTVTNAFAMGALRGRDGGFLLGEMAVGTANQGKVYFPCGTPDPSDAHEGVVDFAGSVVREMREETGIGPEDYEQGAWFMVPAWPRLALIRILQSRVPADAICERARAHMAAEDHPELARVYAAYGPADLDDGVLDFVQAFLLHAWR